MSAAMIIEGFVRKVRTPVINRTYGRELVLPMAIGLVLFFFLFTRLGWLVTTTLLFGGATFSLRRRHTVSTAVTSFLVAAAVAAFFYFVFGEVFYVPWPEGTWLEPLFGG